ncbi:DUF4041 domain-containing protein [Bacillus sp. AFS088145]|uniref:DUF4041 domain-containing protein n=1 Tax=Bacillus sp. AFS088145 TaxID=2033514 RepID=UPI000BF746D9|nr:DUF4041 domain-containing protein [Bacillus sp. AFS088145]PFH83595.1 chromosome segregation ATPase [Bacillus sp. AFS088145]
MHKQKWYLSTIFICLLFSLWFLIIPLIAGIVLLVLKWQDNKSLREKLKKIQDYETHIKEAQQDLDDFRDTISDERDRYRDQLRELKDKSESNIRKLEETISSLKKDKEDLILEIEGAKVEAILKSYDYSDYDSITSEECKNKLSVLKAKEQNLIKENNAYSVSSTSSQKEINNNIKQALRCFNSECDNITLSTTVKNIDTLRGKIQRSFDSINKIFSTDGVQLSMELLEIKLEQLNLIYTFELKREEEKEIQKAIKEQMLEEEKVRKEIEIKKRKIEKDEIQFKNEIKKLMTYMQNTSIEVEKMLYIDKIREYEDKLEILNKDKEDVLNREQNTRAGFVYIISNIGSFGENVYKIGMTRRLEPMDRVKELGSASVPFLFDVHAMIFSDNAPTLESELHKSLNSNRVNKINERKEFFKVTLDEIEEIVKNNHNNTVEFTRIPVASEYRKTLEINQKVTQEV